MALSDVSGGLHATSWNSHFPSRIEALLWRIACAGIGVFLIATYLVALSGDSVDATVHAIWETQYAQRNSPLSLWRNYLNARDTAAKDIERQARERAGQNTSTETSKPGKRWLFRVDFVFHLFFG
jgi:hypothetical protein